MIIMFDLYSFNSLNLYTKNMHFNDIISIKKTNIHKEGYYEQ